MVSRRVIGLLRTEDVVQIESGVDWNEMKSEIVNRVRTMFHEYPDYFFTGRDILSLLCDISNEELRLKGVEPTNTADGYVVNLVHQEYPMPFRCNMKEDGFTKKDARSYRRGYYDLIILNPAFVQTNSLDVVCAKDIEKHEAAIKYTSITPLIWACEVLFFPRVNSFPTDGIPQIRQDALKVKDALNHKIDSETLFCKSGSVLVFTSHTAEEAADLSRQIKGLADTLRLEVILSTS
ncbi:hypothetical protein GTO27_01150 [Candidatus Bathyarchaeota archaeon]|nr:hypothetical protein [Candidatus Bathyarchaeota archaeon]